MSDLWSAALQEAYASAPADEFIVQTLELIHPAFVDEADLPDSIRVVLDNRAWSLPLEAGAPLRGGETVTFDPFAMDLTRPEQVEGKLGEFKLSIDGVPRIFIDQLDAAIGVRATALLIYREWVAARNTETGVYALLGDAPDYVLPGMTVKLVDIEDLSIVATAGFMDLLNRGFPRRKFIRELFPLLF